MKYRIGDKVVVRKDLEIENIYGKIPLSKNMARLCGKVVTIKKFNSEWRAYKFEEDEYGYSYAEEMLEPVVTNFDKAKEHFTFMDFDDDSFCNAIHKVKGEENCDGRSCIGCKEWLVQPYEESKKEILDETEKEYLSAVIKPFRNKVLHIEKQLGVVGEYISISLGYDEVCLPYYKRGTMYKGMEIGKGYTLKELGL